MSISISFCCSYICKHLFEKAQAQYNYYFLSSPLGSQLDFCSSGQLEWSSCKIQLDHSNVKIMLS